MSWWLTFPLSAFQNLPTTPYKLIYLKRPKEQYNFVYISVGSKNSATLAHFIQSPRPMPRRKKCPRMNKESPNCQETSPRTILSSASQDHKKEKQHAVKDSLPGHPMKKGLTQWDSHRSMVEKQFQEKLSHSHQMPTTNDLAALIRKWPLSSTVLVAATHRRFGKAADGTSTRVTTCMINKWRAKIN